MFDEFQYIAILIEAQITLLAGEIHFALTSK